MRTHQAALETALLLPWPFPFLLAQEVWGSLFMGP